MRLNKLQDAVRALFQNRRLTPALDTLNGNEALRGPELEEFLNAVDSLAKRVHDVNIEDDPIVRPWI